MPENTIKKIWKKVSSVQGSPSTSVNFWTALVKIPKAPSTQLSQPWATLKCILRCLSSAVLGEAKTFFLALFLLPILWR